MKKITVKKTSQTKMKRVYVDIPNSVHARIIKEKKKTGLSIQHMTAYAITAYLEDRDSIFYKQASLSDKKAEGVRG